MQRLEVMRARTIVVVLFGLLAASGCRKDADAGRGDAGARRHRIVSLTPSSTELVAALGAIDEIVGVDVYSSFPEEVRHLPKVGDYLAPNLEAILALHPDIAVVDSVQTAAAAKLEASGIKVVSLPMRTIDDVRTGLRAVAAPLDRIAQAEAAIARFDTALSAIRETASARRAAAGRAPRVLWVVDRRVGGLGGIYAAGPGTFLDEVLALLQVDNALARSPVPYANIGAEHIVELAPDVIIETSPATDRARARADWDALASVPAVAHGRVYVVDEPVLQSPGPRLPDALARVLPLVWPAPATP